MSDWPTTWATTTVGAVVELNPKTADLADTTLVGFVPMALLGKSYLDAFTFRPRFWGEVRRGYTQFCDGDVLLAKITPCFENGKAGLVRGLPNGVGAGSTEYFVCRPRTGVVEARYLLAFMKTAEFVNGGAAQMTGSVGHKRVPKEYLSERVLPLPPLEEQTRIADKLDTLLARIQACNDRLDAIPLLLKRFRQTVLEAALSGRTTDDWREAESSSLEGWRPAIISDIAVVGTGSTPLRSNGNFFSKSGTAWVTSAATSRPYVDTADEFVTPAAISAHRLKIYAPGTLLVAMYGEGKTRGQVSELRIHAAINQACAAVSVDRRKASTEFVKLALLAQYEQMRALAEGGNQPNLNLSKVKGIPVLLPPEREQAEIVRRVKSLFALADRIEARHAAAVAHVQRLTSLTLAKAFRGELVQQDVNDEPASVLLQRIAKTPATAVKTQWGRPRPQQPNEFTTLPAMQLNWVALPAGAWAAGGQPDEHATTAQLIAMLKSWGEPMPQDQARLAAVLCLQPRLFTAALPSQDAVQWRRLVGAEAEPLPASVAALQPAVNTHWRRALTGLRARGDLVVSRASPQDTWALGPGADRVDTTGWPDGRAGWVTAYLRAHGVEALLPLLSSAAVDFVHARAA